MPLKSFKTMLMKPIKKTNENRTKILHLQIQLGSPITPNCTNFGICRVQLAGQKPKRVGKKCTCYVYATMRLRDGNQLEINFPINEMCLNVKQKYFSGRFFRVDSTFWMPPEILEKLGLEEFPIFPGWYPLQRNESGFRLLLEVLELSMIR